MKYQKTQNPFHSFMTVSSILLAALFLISGCASSSKRINTYQTQIDNLKREIRFLKDRNSQLEREQDDLKARLDEQVLSIRQNKADLSSQLLEVSRQLEEVQNQLQETNDRMTALMQRAGSMRSMQPASSVITPESDTSSVAQTAPPSSFGLDESREIYNTAYRDVLRGNYQLALQGFQQFIQQYPNTDLTDNAQYWLGEVYYAQGRFPDAIEEFEKVVKWYPNSEKRSPALLKIGYSYINVEEFEQGKLYLQEVIKDFPDSQEANLARGRLAALK
ncbi:MAG: tol-pal system protein YbgF [bacterium]